MPLLTPNEQTVYHRLYRLTVGHDREECTVGYQALARACNINWRTAIRVVDKLVAYGLVGRLGSDLANPNQAARGNRYRLLPYTVTEAPVLRTKAARKAGAGMKAETVGGAGMKEIMKENLKPPLYRIREIGLQLREQRRGNEAYTRADLREDVKRTCAGQGIEYTDALIEEALGKVGL
jgi:hypothetical protein